MDNYKRLSDNLAQLLGRGNKIAIYQGIVKSVEGLTCTVTFGSLDVDGIRLRASTSDNESNLLIVPAVGTPVTVGSLSGDLSQLVVLVVDQAESITINGGKLGGMINIAALTDKINELVDRFNSHTHQVTGVQPGSGSVTAPATIQKADKFNKNDYEDSKITH